MELKLDMISQLMFFQNMDDDGSKERELSHFLPQNLKDLWVVSYEDVVEGFEKVKAKLVEKGMIPSSRVLSTVVKDSLKGKVP